MLYCIVSLFAHERRIERSRLQAETSLCIVSYIIRPMDSVILHVNH